MPDFNAPLSVRLDPDILNDLIYGGNNPEQTPDKTSTDQANLRELQVYRLMRSIVSEFNTKLKGRRERFKLVEEGDGLIIEFCG